MSDAGGPAWEAESLPQDLLLLLGNGQLTVLWPATPALLPIAPFVPTASEIPHAQPIRSLYPEPGVGQNPGEVDAPLATLEKLVVLEGLPRCKLQAGAETSGPWVAASQAKWGTSSH